MRLVRFDLLLLASAQSTAALPSFFSTKSNQPAPKLGFATIAARAKKKNCTSQLPAWQAILDSKSET